MGKVIDRKISDFFSHGTFLKCKRGEILINAGDEPNGVYYLSKGYVKMNSIFKNGSELTLNIFKHGAFFPMMWALGEAKNTYFYQTISTANIYRVPKEKVLRFVKEDPSVLFDLTKRILVGLDGLLTNVSQLLYGSSYNRVASAILISAKRFGKRFKDGSVLIDLSLTHQDIADLAGITRETVSLAMEKLARKKVIARSHKKIVVGSLQVLEQEASISIV